MKVSGQCLCGKVKFSFKNNNHEFHACHCKMCRTWGGGPSLTVDCDGELEIDGKDSISHYSSSDWAERTFCKHCGTNLYYHLKGSDFYNFNLGTIDNEKDFKFTKQIYIDSMPGNYEFANPTKMMTGQEVFDAYSGE